MVKKVSGVGTVKMFLVMFIVFVFSFLLTVNAFAEWAIAGKEYYGTYQSNTHSVGYINANQENMIFNVYLHVYREGESDLISGVSEEGSLRYNDYWFRIPYFKVVDSDGKYLRSREDATVSGTTKVDVGFWGSIKTITLTPTYINLVKYKLTK